jgi:hypothetical protein
VHVDPPVEVIRTVVAVTDPFAAAGPNALTQSPTAKSLEAADCVALSSVDPDVVIVSFWVLGVAGFAFFALFEFFVLEALVRANDPGLTLTPDTEMVVPVTPVTFPVANASDARAPDRRLGPPPKEGGVPPRKLGGVPPLAWPVRKEPPGPPGPRKAPPEPPARPVHRPEAVAGTTEMLRAAIVFLDDLDAVPVTVMQSPVASWPTDCFTIFENCVVAVQLTVVWPLLGFCTSMLDAERAATLPVVPKGVGVGVDAASAADPMVMTAAHAIAPAAMYGVQRRVGLGLISARMSLSLSLDYSFRRASMGARCAARLAG